MGISNIIQTGLSILEKVIPDQAQRDAAKLELLKMDKNGDLKELELSLSAIISDSQSADPWTSRARPTFLYVVYILLLWSIPVGIFYTISPDSAERFITGYKLWLASIPDSVLTLFGTVMTGYVLGRSWEKVKGKA